MIRLFREDATRTVTVLETASETRDPIGEHFRWQARERERVDYEATTGDEGVPPRVRLVREGTRISLESATLTVEELVDFARSFSVVVREQP